MEIKTPGYWNEEKFQPLLETETVYGHKVKVPEIFMDLWQEMKEMADEAETLPPVNRMSYTESIMSDLEYLIHINGGIDSDFAKVMLEIYEEPTIPMKAGKAATEIKTPSYWKEAEYQPLLETETVYGHKVKVPERFLGTWELIKECAEDDDKATVNRMDYMDSVMHGLNGMIETRSRRAADFAKVLLEIYDEAETPPVQPTSTTATFMRHISIEEMEKALENAPPLTPEERERMRELGEKLKKRSREESKAILDRLDAEDGYC